MSTIIVITPPTKPPSNESLTAQQDGKVTDADGNVRMHFNSYADAIAYLQHLDGQSWMDAQLAEATDDRA